jgi:D-lactate dehydrogenase (cytochrome)
MENVMSNTLTFERPADQTITSTVDALKKSYGDRAVTTHAIREQHSHGEGMQDAGMPDVVVFPETNEEVASIVKLCNQARIPVIAFGTGTSLEGHLKALYGGVCIDMSRMVKILEINADDLDCRVQAGVTREQLNTDIRHTGLFFPIDPGANASIGGMSATRASGTNAVRYGTMKENILGLTVVTPDGRIIKTGTRARKSSSGYDLTRLYIGSEGTLGIITEIQLKLYGVPERISAAVCQFDELPNAVNTVITAMQMGIPMARIELLDAVQMDACIKYSKLEGFAAKPTLFMEFHGTDAYVAEQIEQMKSITADYGGSDYRFADKQEDRSKLWKARHDAYWAGMAYTPGKQAFATDSCVPISRLADCIAAAKAEVDNSNLVCMIVGHVGDGNFHVQITFDPNDKDERARADRVAERIAHIAIEMGGTCTGEHGIGIHKLEALKVEHGEAVDVMRTIKKALDPNNIMNPGKTIPMH